MFKIQKRLSKESDRWYDVLDVDQSIARDRNGKTIGVRPKVISALFEDRNSAESKIDELRGDSSDDLYQIVEVESSC